LITIKCLKVAVVLSAKKVTYSLEVSVKMEFLILVGFNRGLVKKV
jgi:hypothetical protein